MVRWLLRRAISAFERQWNYDASYLREIVDASPRAAWRFLQATRLSNYRHDVPLEVWSPQGSRRPDWRTAARARNWAR